jgi:hypothetical protein
MVFRLERRVPRQATQSPAPRRNTECSQPHARARKHPHPPIHTHKNAHAPIHTHTRTGTRNRHTHQNTHTARHTHRRRRRTLPRTHRTETAHLGGNKRKKTRREHKTEAERWTVQVLGTHTRRAFTGGAPLARQAYGGKNKNAPPRQQRRTGKARTSTYAQQRQKTHTAQSQTSAPATRLG